MGIWKDDRLEAVKFNDIVRQMKNTKLTMVLSYVLLLFLQVRFLPWEGVAWGVCLYFVERGAWAKFGG